MPEPLKVTTPNDLEIRVTRTFDAPRELVWDAHTKPELVQRWMLGPSGWTMPVCEMDLRVGGRYRWRWRSEADGSEFGFVGDFVEIERPVKLVHTERVDGSESEGEVLVTMTLHESNGRTTLEVTIRFASKEERDAAAATGMTGGMEHGYARLDEMFGSNRARPA